MGKEVKHHKVTGLPVGPWNPNDIYFLYTGTGRVERWIVAKDGLSIKKDAPFLESDISDLDKYTQAQITAFLLDKSNTGHTHTEAQITDLDKYTKAEVDALLAVISSSAIDERYADITALIADQNAQGDKFLYFVLDASDDPTVGAGYAYYEYLDTVLGTMADYRKLSEEESMDAIIPPQTPTTTLGDIITRGATEDERLPIGVEASVLKVEDGKPIWSPTGQALFAHYTQDTLQNLGGPNGTAVELDFDGTPIADDAFFTKVGTKIYVTEDCRISVNSNIRCNINGASRLSLFGYLRINEVNYLYNVSKSYSRGTAYGASVIIDLNTELDLLAGDNFEVRSAVEDADGTYTCWTVVDQVELIIRRVDTSAPAGAQGPIGLSGANGDSPTLITTGLPVVDLGNSNSNWYVDSASLEDTFTLINTTINFGNSRVRIDTTGKAGFPAVTGSDPFDDIIFEVDTEYDMWIENDSIGINHFFRKRS